MVNYAARADVFAYGEFSATEQADVTIQGRIDDLIAQVSLRFDRLAKRAIVASGDSTRYFDLREWQEGRLLYLDDFLVAVTSITNGDGATIVSDKYTLLPLNSERKTGIRLKADSGISWVYSEDVPIAIVGEWAFYPSGSVPEDIKLACVKAVWSEYKMRDIAVDSDEPIVTQHGAVIMPNRWSKDVWNILQSVMKVL